MSVLSGRFDFVTIDLPGFGDNMTDGFDCTQMAQDVTQQIALRQSATWMIAGHSMGGKIAMMVAAMAERGTPGLQGLTHLILIAASTLEPEPMDDAVRHEMIGWVAGGTPLGPEKSRQFITDNTYRPLPTRLQKVAMHSLAGTDPAAWSHWLSHGSREDQSATIAPLATPALILAGEHDGALGEAAQRRLNAPKFADASVGVIADCAHLVPLEQPAALAAAMLDFILDRPARPCAANPQLHFP